MKIKTYIADSVQEALYKVKSDLGKDAVILQTKHIKRGGFLGFFAKSMVEVVAGNDISLGPKPQKRPIKPILTTLPEPIPSATLAKSSGDYQSLRSDIDEVKDIVKKLYSEQRREVGSTDTKNMPSFLKRYYDKMMEMEIYEEIINGVLSKVEETLSDDELDDNKLIYDTVKSELCTFINKVEPIKLNVDNNVVAFIGPTGVGKTTTIAKLAANFSLYKNKKVAMITADTFRVGAIEQLKMYGDLLEIPVMVVYNLEDVATVLRDLKSYDLILVDTMGFSPNNKLQIKKVKSLLDTIAPNDVHMVISAATKEHDMTQILSNYRELNYNKILITKIDETQSYGLILNALKIAQCNLSYITIGQDVPEDIEVPSAEKIATLILEDI